MSDGKCPKCGSGTEYVDAASRLLSCNSRDFHGKHFTQSVTCRIRQLEAENKRFREALEKIRDLSPVDYATDSAPEIAREALGGEK